MDDSLAAVESYRHCTQWITAAAAAVAAAFVAGLQLTALRDLAWWRTLLGVLAAAAVVGCAGWVIQRAARVLAPYRVTMAELADSDMKIAQGKASPADVNPEVRRLIEDVINRNKGWLFPPGVKTVTDLYDLACGRTLRGRREQLPDQEAAHVYVQRLVHFVELHEIRRRYEGLLQSLPKIGLIALVAVSMFVLVARRDAPDRTPRVTRPLPVQVIFTGDKSALRSEQWPAGCAGATTSGSAVGGTLKEPEVATIGTNGCPPHRGTVRGKVGLVLYPK
ncbi:hypothetical protein QCN29_07245 [Streptomyces sp. HNM0663]|uniref:Uncharacterized protein n=1 Tax=Streptomyces chengmaiensis TaxID=3040919 RepID=A0ABT6HIK7_9ACTN|nr:hypothetical protein [Streptomyces chengmaiensis]MDH2388582.1 hypothetical protein [Streptomyces chengmaiensis]